MSNRFEHFQATSAKHITRHVVWRTPKHSSFPFSHYSGRSTHDRVEGFELIRTDDMQSRSSDAFLHELVNTLDTGNFKKGGNRQKRNSFETKYAIEFDKSKYPDRSKNLAQLENKIRQLTIANNGRYAGKS
ncbi:hypothetical protein J6590_087351 [Homalodisca vitripennis]|nr:hypothetical protein J6590_087351 [Homalodisca vitripennis]